MVAGVFWALVSDFAVDCAGFVVVGVEEVPSFLSREITVIVIVSEFWLEDG